MREPFTEQDLRKMEATTQEVGRHIFDHLSRRQPNVLQRRWWDDRIMSWAMQDESVKVQMFRFIDVLPMLHTSEAITRHLHEYFRDVQQHLPRAVRLGLSVATPKSIAGRALALAARRNALGHARRFIAGTNSSEVLAAAMRERKLRRAFTLDILGEAVTSEVEADRYLGLYIGLIESIAPTVNGWTEVPQIDRSQFASLPRVNVSVKLSALDSQFDPVDPVGTTVRVAARLRKLLRAAHRHQAYVHVDMESYQAKDLTLAIFKQVLGEEEFRGRADVGIVIQCYLKDALADLVSLRDWATHRGTPVWVRLVKGAYWDYETVHAESLGWDVPVFDQKWQSDATFEAATRFVLLNHDLLRPALASHNVRSLAHGIACARHLGLPVNGLELQMLYGMGDQEKQALVDMGYRVRVYMPYGELIPGMAYLVRRLLENTSNDSFLRASFTDQVSPRELLRNPADLGREIQARAVPARRPRQIRGTPSLNATGDLAVQDAFRNEPITNFALAASRDNFAAALAQVRQKLGGSYPLWINAHPVETRETANSVDPARHDRVVGVVAQASERHAREAVTAAHAALGAWHGLGVQARAELLRQAADVMRGRRFELCAWEVFECGKGWREADGDVCEAIDFCEYYAQQAEHWLTPRHLDVPGEENQFEYLPRGVVAVIAPWNFPLAILTGMTVAALVTGNTVVMKPAEQAPVVAAKLMEIFTSLGLPPGVLNYLPGRGEIAGNALVEHPDVALIAFTGSRAVGLSIHRKAAEQAGVTSALVKRVIAEMGGKNAIIVDEDADVDEAVLGVVKSAFGYQGQKCSACSRVIVLDAIHDAFLQRLVEATRSLKVGPPEEPATSVGPLIDVDSVARVKEYIAIARAEGREVLAIDVGDLAQQGYYVGPHIFADIPATGRLAQEEVFGPVLAVIRAKDMTQALEIANHTDYALTGGVFSRSPANLDRARREFQVGNLYLNRGITGALVGRQPFGGFKMSGIGSKAGGQDYLLQFLIPRTITENTLRRGFAPAPEEDADSTLG